MGISYLLDTHILLWWLFDDPKLNSIRIIKLLMEVLRQ